MKKKIIAIGVPCYNEGENVIPCYFELTHVIKSFEDRYIFQFIFVDNGSLDDTRVKTRNIAKKDHRVVGIFLSRNFGPEASGEAAMAYTKADAFIYYPCDMQDPADLIPVFIRKWEQGYDSVVGVYTKSRDVFVMAAIRWLFYRLFKIMSDIEIPTNAGVFSLIDRKVLDALKLFPEKFRFFRGLRAWVGFKTTYVTYERQKRKHGKSSYNMYRYFKHAERSFFGFSYLPLDLIIYAGLTLAACSMIVLIGYLISIIALGNPVNASMVLFITILLFSSIQLLAISMVGKYNQVILEETKARPMFIVEEVIGGKA